MSLALIRLRSAGIGSGCVASVVPRKLDLQLLWHLDNVEPRSLQLLRNT